MNDTIDHHGINHMLVSISREMTKDANRSGADADTIFMGGTTPTENDQKALADFALSKNYNIIFPSFDPNAIGTGPITFHAVVTDGHEQATVLPDGRLWKRDRRSPSILLFPELRAVLRMSTKGRLLVREMTGSYHKQGYEAASEAIRTTAARKPARAPIMSSIGDLMIVMDVEAMMTTLQAA